MTRGLLNLFGLLALTGMASFLAGVRPERYSEWQDWLLKNFNMKLSTKDVPLQKLK